MNLSNAHSKLNKLRPNLITKIEPETGCLQNKRNMDQTYIFLFFFSFTKINN